MHWQYKNDGSLQQRPWPFPALNDLLFGAKSLRRAHNCVSSPSAKVSDFSLANMASHRYTPGQVAEGDRILDDTSLPIYERAQTFFAFLREKCGVGFKGVVHTDDLLCHPENRSGLLINAHDAHRKGSKAKHSGSNLKALHDAVCMEISADPATRKDRHVTSIRQKNRNDAKKSQIYTSLNKLLWTYIAII